MFIISTVTNKIDYYNLFLNNLIQKIQINFCSYLEEEFHNYTNESLNILIIAAYFKLFDDFCQGEFYEKKEFNFKLKSDKKLSFKLPSFGAYFVRNFNRMFHSLNSTKFINKTNLFEDALLFFPLKSRSSYRNNYTDKYLKIFIKTHTSLCVQGDYRKK